MAEYAADLLCNLAYSGASGVPPYRRIAIRRSKLPKTGRRRGKNPFGDPPKPKKGERVRLKGARAESAEDKT
jgi:hypothetical protein